MEPGLESGQRVLVNQVAYYFREPERGDVIIFDPPFKSEEPFIKRIIGLPGESVEIKQGTVYIHKNGNTLVLDEPYLKEPPAYTFKGDTLPEDEYFVLGDNRNNSQDSHTGWTVKREDIIAKAWLSIWPWDRWGVIANPLQ
ncbi:Signal peptidase I T [subsurface metagenome]